MTKCRSARCTARCASRRRRRTAWPTRWPTATPSSTLRTTAGYLSRGATFSLTAYGGTGNDQFTVYSNKAETRLEGNDGNDVFVVRAFALAGEDGEVLEALSTEGITQAVGGEGADTVLYNINAPVDLDGGAGFDKVVVIGTEFDDTFVITDEGVFGAGLNVRYNNMEAARRRRAGRATTTSSSRAPAPASSPPSSAARATTPSTWPAT